MGNISVVIWLLILSVAASDKLPDELSELIGGYLPPSNSFGAQPPKDPFQGLSFALPSPSNTFPQKAAVESVEEQYIPPKQPSKEPHAEVHEGTCILANPYQQASQSQPKQEPPQQIYKTPDESKEIKQIYEAPKFSEESKVEESLEIPDSSSHSSPEASEESDVAQPQFLYEPPEQSPSSHFASPQHNFKPQQSESPQKTFQVPELIQTYQTPEDRPKPKEDPREGSIHFSTNFSPPKNDEEEEDEEEKDEQQQSSSLFFKVPQRPKVSEEDSTETYKAPSKPKQTHEFPRPSYEVPRPTYTRPQTDDNKSKEKSSKGHSFFKIPTSQGSSLESSNESPEGSYKDQDDEETIPSQQEVEQSEEAYRPPSSDQRPKQTFRPPQKSKPSFKPTDNVKFRPLFKKPKPTQQKDSREHTASFSRIESSSGYKVQEPSSPHNFFKVPSGTKSKESSEKKDPVPSRTYNYQPPKKESEEESDRRPSGSIRFPTKQNLKPPKKNDDDDDESKGRQPSEQTYKPPQKTHKRPSDDDSEEKPSFSNLQSTFQKPEESKSQEIEATTMKMMMPYEFKWNVDDDDSGNKFGQTAVSDGMVEKGSYHVLLPDGRKQIVTYLADWETGFHVDVKYEGEVDPFAQGSEDQKSIEAYS